MKSRILIIALIFIMLIPHTVMAEDIHQKITVDIKPKDGNYTKMFNIVDENNSWLDNRHIWEGFRTDGRIVGEGIIPNPIEIHDYSNNSGTARMSVLSVKYLDTYDIMSGTSESYIRLPVAVNTSSYSSSVVIGLKIYAIESNTYNISSFNYTDVKYSTYSSNYMLYASNSTISVSDDISVQTYTYPSNITNLSLELFYLHLRAPLISKSTYILLQYIEVPDAKPNPIYVLGSYLNTTGYYYSDGQVKVLSTSPSWSMLARYGMSEDIYSINLPGYNGFFYNKPENLNVYAGDTVYVSFGMPVYSSNDTTVDINLYTVPEDESNINNTYQDAYHEWKSLKKGINNIFINYSFKADRDAIIKYLRVYLCAHYPSNGSDIYIYIARNTNGAIYEFEENFSSSPVYYWASQMLFYDFVSTSGYITFQQFYFEGLQEPKIIYKTKYVYSLLDFPIFIYKINMLMITNVIYFLTFGQVDLRYLYSNDFILKMAEAAEQGLKAFLGMARHSIFGLFIRTIVDFLVNSAAWWGNWLLQFALFLLNVAVYAVFIWPWLVLYRGFILLQDHGVNSMLSYYSSYVDKVTSVMAKLLRRGG